MLFFAMESFCEETGPDQYGPWTCGRNQYPVLGFAARDGTGPGSGCRGSLPRLDLATPAASCHPFTAFAPPRARDCPLLHLMHETALCYASRTRCSAARWAKTIAEPMGAPGPG
ncbi:hypothetical protein GCM10010329_57980 [Streptomyces spiroverticillatus]|nr:hypothetical protein GCM10010329_57980 [Streptomyces spiroverticillatus]